MRRHWKGALLAATLLASLLLPAQGHAQAGALAIAIQPESGPPGTTVTVFGRGASPGAQVRLLYASWSSQIDCRAGRAAAVATVVTADARGQFTATHQASRAQVDQVGLTYLAQVVDDRSTLTSPLECFAFETPGIYPQTGYRIDGDPFLEYVAAYGGVETFGFPVSRAVPFLGCTTQFFQRHVLQRCADGPVRPMNLLDPGLLDVRSINFSAFPAHDLAHLRATLPDAFEDLPVDFFSTFVNTVPDAPRDPALTVLANLEVWGFPTSRPAFDPQNHGFVYQRFQRGIMHFSQVDRATRGVLLGDWFKAVLTGDDLPADLAQQMQGSPFLRQYCPTTSRSLCRPGELPDTDLSGAFQAHGE